MNGSLIDCLTFAAGQHPERIAMADQQGALTYEELEELSARVRDRLRRMNVGRGDRVGIYMRNSIDACATMLGVLRAGAIYVPIPAGAPAPHAALMTHGNDINFVIAERELLPEWREEMANYGAVPPTLEIGRAGGGLALWLALYLFNVKDPAPIADDDHEVEEQLAHIA